MNCETCGGKLGVNRKCSVCGAGYVAMAAELPTVEAPYADGQPEEPQRSVRLVVFMVVTIVIALFNVVPTVRHLFDAGNALTIGLVVHSVWAIGAQLALLVLCIFILQFKAWALFGYILMTGINLFVNSLLSILLMALIGGTFVGIVMNNMLGMAGVGLFLYFIFRKDYHRFA